MPCFEPTEGQIMKKKKDQLLLISVVVSHQEIHCEKSSGPLKIMLELHFTYLPKVQHIHLPKSKLFPLLFTGCTDCFEES